MRPPQLTFARGGKHRLQRRLDLPLKDLVKSAPGGFMDRVDPLFSLAGKTALVTGGGSGIGAMIAAGLLRRGVKTYITGRDGSETAQRAAELAHDGACIGLAADFSGDAGVTELAEAF